MDNVFHLQDVSEGPEINLYWNRGRTSPIINHGPEGTGDRIDAAAMNQFMTALKQYRIRLENFCEQRICLPAPSDKVVERISLVRNPLDWADMSVLLNASVYC